MLINITLVIQVIHFFITYAILSKLIFKPVLAQIQSRDKKEKDLTIDLENKKNLLLLKEHQKHQKLLNFQYKIKDKYPMPKKEIAKIDGGIGYTRNEKEVRCLAEKIKDLIIKEASRVR